MPGTQLSRRHFSIRARQSQRKLKDGSVKMSVNCWKDFISFGLMPIKVTFFFIMGATQCTAPYTTLLMKSLGLSVLETAYIYTIGPIIPIIAPFLAGFLTDKIGNFRMFLVVTVAMSGCLSLIHTLIPPARTKLSLDTNLVNFDLSCDMDFFEFSYAQSEKCRSPNSTVSLDSINATMCGYLCSPPPVQMDFKYQQKSNDILIQKFVNDSYSLHCEVGLAEKQKCFANNLNKTMIINKFSIRNVVLDFEKVIETGQIRTFILKIITMTPSDTKNYDCKLGQFSQDISIRKILMSSKGDQKYPTGPPEYVRCRFHCEGKLAADSVCQKKTDIISHDVSLTFWLLVFSQTVDSFLLGLTYSMFEAAVVAVLKQNNHDYGIQRIYGSVGGMIFAPLSGYFIDYFGSGYYSDFYVGYYFYCSVRIICALIITQLNLAFREPAKSICGNIAEIFTNIESLLLIFVVFISGMCYGFIEHFLPWHMHDLGAENWVIGLMTTVASFAAIPVMAMSYFLCGKFGHVQCISFGIICYSIRTFGYSNLYNPYWCFPFEVLEGITTGLLVAAAIIYGAKLSQECKLGTLQGMLATSHYGFGKSAGSLLGGYLMSKLGTRIAFQIFSGGSFLVAFMYYLIYKLVIKPKEDELERLKREVSAMPYEVVPLGNLAEGLEPADKNPENLKDAFPITSTPKKSLDTPVYV